MGRLQSFLVWLSGVLGAGAVYQAIATVQDRRYAWPSGARIDIGGRSLELFISGEGDPTVVIEAGLAAPGLFYNVIQAEVAKFTRVVSYDRAGLGWSDPGARPFDGARTVADLHAALQAAGIAPPYILVGHSWGGLYIRQFTARYPDEVVGLVFIDSSHEDQWARLPPALNSLSLNIAAFRFLPWLARLGLLRIGGAFLRLSGQLRQFPPEAQAPLVALVSRPQQWQGAYEEAADSELTAAQVRAIGHSPLSLGDRPLEVVTAGATFTQNSWALPRGVSGAEIKRIWLELQTELAALSTQGHQHIAENATHISLLLSDASVSVDAIRTAVDTVRALKTSVQKP